MGLSIYRSTIKAHDGRLFVVPNNRRGAEFRFVLGRSERQMQNLAKFQQTYRPVNLLGARIEVWSTVVLCPNRYLQCHRRKPRDELPPSHRSSP
jgi:hypothetical protein